MTNGKTLLKGVFVCIEGIDGAGKTTQARMLIEALSAQGYDCVYLKEPTDGPWGKKIRALAKEGRHEITPMREFELFLKDREEDVNENIRPALEDGRIVVMDRYYYSSIAYQGALGLDPSFINSKNREIAIRPDAVIYLTIPADLAPGRIEDSRGDRANLFESLEYLKKVKAIFDDMNYPEITTVRGDRPAGEVHRDILQIVTAIIKGQEENFIF